MVAQASCRCLMENLRAAIESFVRNARQPAWSEPGEEIIEIHHDNLILEEQNGSLLLQAWDNNRNVVRRVIGIESRTTAKLTSRR